MLLKNSPFFMREVSFKKIYMLYCAITNLFFKIKIHTRGKANQNEGEDDKNMMSKLDKLTLGMCADLEGTGATVNMDNYYMSATTAIHLKQKGKFTAEETFSQQGSFSQ